MRHFFEKLTHVRGFSLMEVLITSALIMTNLGVLSSAVVQYGEVSRKQRIITLAMNVEAALHQSISDPATYNGTDPDAPLNGQSFMEYMISTGFPPDDTTNPAPNFTLALKSTELGNIINVTRFPYSQFFNEDLNACTPDFTNKFCVLQLEVDRLQVAATPPTYAFAYRIKINPELQIKVQNLGVPEDSAFTQTRTISGVTRSDYNVYVPQYLLMTNIQTLCPTAGFLTAGLTGFDRNTGQAHCIQRPEVADECPANFMGKGLQVVPNGGNYKMKLICVRAQEFTCGNANNDASLLDYSLRTLDAKSFDSDYYALQPGALVPPATPNKCVYTSENPSLSPVTYNSGANHTGVNVASACPPRYNYSGGCSHDTVAQVSQGSCTCCTARDFYGDCTSSTVHTWNSTSSGVVDNISSTNFSPGTDSGNCFVTDTTPVPGVCTCDLIAGPTSPVVRANIIFRPNCSLEGPTQNEIDAGRL